MFSPIATPRPSDQSATAAFWLFRFATLLRSSRVAINHAYTQQRLFDHHPDAAFHDAGLSRSDATGVGSHQNALPFFLQSGFGKQ